MRIKKLSIVSFRNLKDLEFELDEKLNVFKGINSVGKTTIIDSIMWVLCGETLVYGKQDSDNRNKNNLKGVVNVKLELENNLVLERKYQDIWKEDFEGNLKYVRTDNKFLIDNATYGKEEFYERIRNDLGLEYNVKTKDFNILRFLIDYNYFGEIDYKVARKFLEEVLKIKKDEEMVRESKFESIAVDMINQKFEYGKVLNKYKNDIETKNKGIALKEKEIASLKNDIDKNEIEKYEEYVKERTDISNFNIFENNVLKALDKQIEEIDINIQESEKLVLNDIISVNTSINELQRNGNNLKYAISEVENEINKVNSAIDFCKNEIKQKELEIKEVKKQEYAKLICPECNCVVNKNGLEAFEESKKKEIKECQSDIEDYKKMIEDNIEKIKMLKSKYNDFVLEFENNKEKYNNLENKLKELEKKRLDNVEVVELKAKKEELKNQRAICLTNLIQQKNEKLERILTKLSKVEVMKSSILVIADFQESIKKLKQERAICEMKIELVKEFKQTKINQTKELVKTTFPKLDIQLNEINENTNSVKETCYVQLKGVEYKGTNDGYQYLLGIQIIEDIKSKMGLKDLPIIFDKFADIDKSTLAKIQEITKSQIITTLVSEDKEIKLN